MSAQLQGNIPAVSRHSHMTIKLVLWPEYFRGHNYQVEGGPVIDLFNHVQIKASYYYSSIPGDQGAWSGHGWHASLQLIF